MGVPIKNITIVGGGTSGWITACYLARVLETKIAAGEMAITLIESPRIAIIGVGESTARPMMDLLQMVGVNESEFIKSTDATFKMSGVFDHWDVGENGEKLSWINPFYSVSDILGVNPGYVFARHAMQDGGNAADKEFTDAMSVCPTVIRAHKGPRLISDGDFQARVPYSYHMNAIELAKLLAKRGKALGVTQILDEVNDVKLDDRGFVSALSLDEHGDFPVEFVIDATGFASVIIGKAMGEPFDPYDKYLLNDRAVVMQLPHENPAKIEPASRATGMNAGWSFYVPLYNRAGSGYVYASQFISDDAAVTEFKKHAGPAATGVEPRIIRMRIGKSRRSWVKNCLAIGLSSGFVEPLEATAIFSVQVALRWLRNYFPDTDFDETITNHYNSLIDRLYEEIVEFISLNFYLSNRDDTPYWRAVGNDLEIPPRLRENLNLWRHTMPDEDEFRQSVFFSPSSYRSALMGKRIIKGRDFAQAASVSKAQWNDYLLRHDQRTQALLQVLPDHYQLLRHIRGEAA